MTKGPRPPKNPPTPTPSDFPPTVDTQQKCWTFIPEEASPIAKDLKTSDVINGSLVNDQILVNSKLGFVGLVPGADAYEMIQYLQGTARRLMGKVLQNDEAGILLQLCAN